MSEDLNRDLHCLEDARSLLIRAAHELSVLVGRNVGGIDIENLRNNVERLIDDCDYYHDLWEAEAV